MRPISRGQEPVGYSLYFPLIPDRRGPQFDLGELLIALSGRFGQQPVFREIREVSCPLIKVGEFATEVEALEMFDYLKAVCAHIAIDSGVPLWFYDSVQSLQDWPMRFPRGWPAAIEAGWTPVDDGGEEDDPVYAQGFRVDSVVTLLYPVVVPEHRRVVENQAMMAYPVKGFGPHSIRTAIESIPSPGECRRFEELRSPVRACMNAYGQDNPALRFLSLATCLEGLAKRIELPSSLGREREIANADLLALVEGSYLHDRSKQHSAAVRRFLSWWKSASRPSATDALAILIERNRDQIVAGLPADHPARDSSEDMAGAIYGLRSMVAHEASLGDLVDERMHRANQFLEVAVKVLMKQALQSPRSAPAS